jgi:hypothetical protein
VEDGSAIFAGLLLGYLAFISVHYAVHPLCLSQTYWLAVDRESGDADL